MVTVILCGGRGTRAYPHTVEVPKPLLDVAGRPILEHVLNIYAQQGCRKFVLAAGYRHEMIREFASSLLADWNVRVVDTGEETGTGERIRLCQEYVGESFFATYADGVGNVNLSALLGHHTAGDGYATITTVPLPSQYGTVEVSSAGHVVEFKEKPRLMDHWINGGFFVMDRAVFGTWSGQDLEKEILPGLAAAGQLRAYRHNGFWKSMDTYKDALDLTALADSGRPPWLAQPTEPLGDEPLVS